MRPSKGRNLILLDPENDHISIGDKKIWIDTRWKPERHVAVSGHVLEVNDKSETQKGDRVYFHYLSVENATQRGEIFRACDLLDTDYENSVMFIDENMLFVSVRNIGVNKDLEDLSTGETCKKLADMNRNVYEEEGEVVMLNGMMLAEPVEPQEKEKIKTDLHIPDNKKLEHSQEYAKLVYVGKAQDGQMDEVEEGDMVLLANSGNIPIEYGLHKKFKGGVKKYFRVPRKNIEGIVK